MENNGNNLEYVGFGVEGNSKSTSGTGPHPVTICIRGHIKGYIEPFVTCRASTTALKTSVAFVEAPSRGRGLRGKRGSFTRTKP